MPDFYDLRIPAPANTRSRSSARHHQKTDRQMTTSFSDFHPLAPHLPGICRTASAILHAVSDLGSLLIGMTIDTLIAFFTNHERALSRNNWGSQSSRLNRESFLSFGSCQLCLLPASDPVACSGCPTAISTSSSSTAIVLAQPTIASATATTASNAKPPPRPTTHIFCRECAIANLLAQKQEIKRLALRSEAARAETEESQRAQDEQAQLRAVDEFERLQAGLNVKLPEVRIKGQRRVIGRNDGKVIVEEDVPVTSGNADGSIETRKRKFEFDEAELGRIADADRIKARKVLADEQEAASKGSSSFWLPSQIGGAGESVDVNKVDVAKLKKMQPLCPGSTPRSPHPISLKRLTAVHFSGETNDADTSKLEPVSSNAANTETGSARSCPSCSRALSNASKAVLLKPCGHVLCGSCVDKFMLGAAAGEHAWEEPAEHAEGTIQCYVCSVDVTPQAKANDPKSKKKTKKKGAAEEAEKERGLFDVASEGTGFAGGGTAEVKREGVAFQC